MKIHLMKFFASLTALFLFITSSTLLCAQDVQFLDGGLNNVKKKKNATFVRTLEIQDDQTYEAEVKDLDGNLKFRGTYAFIEGRFVEHGSFTFFHTNGKVESSGMYENGIKVGTWERYTSSGQQKADRYYNPESAPLIRQVMSQ